MASATPKISVVIPTYNRGDLVRQSIESVLSQTVQADEIIVVDDGSTDDSEEVIARYLGEMVRYHRKEHTGAPDTRNCGLELSTGDYVITVASDDVAMEDLIERHLAAYFANPSLDLYYGDLLATNAELEPFMRVKYPQYLDNAEVLLSTSAFTNQIGDPFTMLRREWALEIGGYDLDFDRCQDWDMWSRRMEGFRLKHIGGDLGFWRWHDTNLSANRKDSNRLSYDRVIRTRVRTAKNGQFHVNNLEWRDLVDRDKDRPVLVWGAGEYGEAMLRMLEWMGVEVSGFVDSDPAKEGTVIEGLKVGLPRRLKVKDTTSRPIVVIASIYEQEIATSLEEMGYEEYSDYFRLYGADYQLLRNNRS